MKTAGGHAALSRRTGCTLARLGVVLAISAPAAARASDQVRPEKHTDVKPEHRPNLPPAFENALRLARMLRDEEVVARLLNMRAMAANCTDAELEEVVSAYEALGTPDRARQVLKARIGRFPKDARAYIALARLLGRDSNTKASATVWAEVKDKFGLQPGHASEYARMLSRQGKHEEGYEILTGVREKATPEDETYWLDLATLAYEVEDMPTALEAYRAAWKRDHDAPYAAERLMTLAGEAGETDEAILVGKDAWKRTKHPTALLFVAEMQVNARRWSGARISIEEAEKTKALFEGHEKYWTLRAQIYAHFGDHHRAREALAVVLQLNPLSISAKEALIWDAIELNDRARLSEYLGSWRSLAENEPLLWSAYAVGLNRVGRTNDAIPFFKKKLAEAPGDYLWSLEFADALETVGNRKLARDLRLRAFSKLRTQAVRLVKAKEVSPSASQLLMMHAMLSRELLGAEEGERWLNHVRATQKRTPELDEAVVSWYLGSDRPEYAKEILKDARLRVIRGPEWAAHRMTIATGDEDRLAMNELLVSERALSPEDRLKAADLLERDYLTIREHDAAIHTDPHSPASPERRVKLRHLLRQHGVIMRLGAAYENVTGLDLVGPYALAAHDVGRFRLIYQADARRMTAPAGDVQLTSPRLEANALVRGRMSRDKSVSELALGAGYQQGEPVPRLEAIDIRQWTRRMSTVLDARMHTKIEDSAALRVAGVRNMIQPMVEYDLTSRLFVIAEGLVAEDHTRQFEFLGSEVGAEAQLGYRILRQAPDWGVGVQAGAFKRWNINVLPRSLARFVERTTTIDEVLPPSYQIVSVTTQFARGDFFERQKQEGVPFPRYDCDASFGYLIPINETAGHVRCAVSAAAPGGGYVSAIGNYVFGVVGLKDTQNAEAKVAYTHVF